jgi:hypothetical protein
VRWKSTHVSEEHVAYIFGVEEKAEQETSVKAKWKQRFRAGFLLGLLLNPDDGDDMFFRNVCWLSTDYTALCPRRHYGVEMSSRGMTFCGDPFTHWSKVMVTASTILEASLLVLLMGGIYEVCCWDGLRWYEVCTKFRKDLLRCSASVTVVHIQEGNFISVI